MNAACNNVRELIPLFPDDLDTNETALVREHVARCAECAAELGVYASQAAIFSRVREGREKVDLFAGIQAKLAQPELRGAIVRPTFGARALFAAAAAGVIITWGLFSLMQPKSVEPKQDDLANRKPVAPTTPEVKKDLVVDKGTPVAPKVRNRGPRRQIFETGEGVMPWFGGGSDKKFAGGDRELTPLDEEAEIPQAQPRKRHFQSSPAQPNPAPKTGDGESLRF